MTHWDVNNRSFDQAGQWLKDHDPKWKKRKKEEAKRRLVKLTWLRGTASRPAPNRKRSAAGRSLSEVERKAVEDQLREDGRIDQQ